MQITFNPNDMTLDDIEFLEEYTGKSIDEVFPKGEAAKLRGKTLTAIAFIGARHSDPDLDLDVFKRTTTMADVTAGLQLVQDPSREAGASKE